MQAIFFYPLIRHLITLFALSFCCWTHAFSQEQERTQAREPQATLIGDEQQLELQINRSDLKDMGAWVAYFNLSLDTGLAEAHLGLSQVDYKIEAGKVFRYVADYEKQWEVVGTCLIEQRSGHTLVRFPKPHLAFDHGPIQWRLALFPHHQQEPLVLPQQGVGSLKKARLRPFLFPSWAELVDRGASAMNASYRQALSHHPSPEIWGNAIAPVPHMEAINVETPLHRALQNPLPSALFWPAGGSRLQEELSLDLDRFQKLSDTPRAIVFPISKLEDQLQTLWINSCRLWAASSQKRAVCFSVQHAQEIPDQAQHVILDWSGETEQRVQALREVRQRYRGQLYAWFDENLQGLNASDRSLSLEAWLSFGVQPLLSPELSIHELEHETIAFAIWFRILVQHQETQWSKVPASIQLSRYRKLKQHAPELYLKTLSRDLQEIWQNR